MGLALLCALCWGTVRLPGDGVVSAVAVLVLTIAAVAYLWGRVEGAGESFALGWPVALVALLAASLPFAVEGHFGILGTSFNPDMSQHLLTAARLTEGHSLAAADQGYPLGPHSIVVALNKGLGIGIVQGFSGLTVAVAILACLTALAAFAELPLAAPHRRRPPRRPRLRSRLLLRPGRLQGDDAGPLLPRLRPRSARVGPSLVRDLPLRYVPAALIAVGSVYTYSFPGLIWPGGAAETTKASSARPSAFTAGRVKIAHKDRRPAPARSGSGSCTCKRRPLRSGLPGRSAGSARAHSGGLPEGKDESEDEEGLHRLLEGALGEVGGDYVGEGDEEGSGGAGDEGEVRKAASAVRQARIATATVRPLKPCTRPIPSPLLGRRRSSGDRGDSPGCRSCDEWPSVSDPPPGDAGTCPG